MRNFQVRLVEKTIQGRMTFEVETLTIHEEPETENEGGGSTENESGTPMYKPRPGGSGTRPRGVTRSSVPNRNRDTGYSSGGGGSGPSEEHEDLKDYIADNPSKLGNGLKLVKKEYTFKLGGRVDILLEDNSGNPVTVEVKPYHIPPESNDEVWQAVRYKHVAAAEYGLRCDQVRSILVAPVIHNDVKVKCKELGIEPFGGTSGIGDLQMSIKFIDLFAGCGGMTLGFQNAGFEAVAALDNWAPAIKVYRANFTHDIHKLDLGNWRESLTTLNSYQFDMIIGGPPCQDFSHAGKRDENLGRADLTVSFARIVAHAKPKWFVMENVDRTVKSQRYRQAGKILRETGYSLTQRIFGR